MAFFFLPFLINRGAKRESERRPGGGPLPPVSPVPVVEVTGDLRQCHLRGRPGEGAAGPRSTPQGAIRPPGMQQGRGHRGGPGAAGAAAAGPGGGEAR